MQYFHANIVIVVLLMVRLGSKTVRVNGEVRVTFPRVAGVSMGIQVRFGKVGGHLLHVGGFLSFRLVRLHVGCACSFW